MKLTVKSPVWDDLRNIGSRIAKDNPKAAHDFFSAARRTFRLLLQHPRLGRLRSFSQPGIRSFVMPRFRNYLIFYILRHDEVQILAVIHGARDLQTVIEARF